MKRSAFFCVSLFFLVTFSKFKSILSQHANWLARWRECPASRYVAVVSEPKHGATGDPSDAIILHHLTSPMNSFNFQALYRPFDRRCSTLASDQCFFE